jgi:hypothetical protein
MCLLGEERGFLTNDYSLALLKVQNKSHGTPLGSFTVSLQEYRELLRDTVSSDEQINQRIEHLEKLCREIIRKELKSHVERK